MEYLYQYINKKNENINNTAYVIVYHITVLIDWLIDWYLTPTLAIFQQ